jgi:hypothetical protein
MQKQGLFVLTGLTLAAIALAGWAVRERSGGEGRPTYAGTKLFPDLASRTGDVAEIAVSDGKESVTLKRVGDAWQIAERGGFPAKLENVKQAVFGFAQLEIEEPKTKKKDQYAALGVQDPAGESTSSKRLVLKDASGAVLAGAVLSAPKYRGSTQVLYARRDGDDQVYQCESKLSPEASVTGWMDTELLRIAQDRVQSVDIVHKDGEEVHVGRSPENHTQFTLENVPPERELASPGAASSIGTALSYLSLDDAKPAAEIDWSADPRAQTRYRCTDGLCIDIESARVDGRTWIRLSASYEEPAGPSPSNEAPTAEGDAAAAATPPAEGEAAAKPDPEKVKQEVETLNKKFTGWAFEIPDYRADSLAKRMEDLLKKPAESGPSPEGAPSAEGGEQMPAELQDLLEQSDGAAETPPQDG